MKYLKYEFWLNLVAWVDLLVYVCVNEYYFVYLKCIFFLSIVCLYIADKQIRDKLELKRIRFALYKLIRLLIMVLIIVLVLSCIFFAIDYAYYV